MNVHHLELFYYVARHGGISEAVRNMPYGIQQPAVSKQFQAGLARLGVEWPVSIEVNSLELIETYVAGGFGIGIAVAIPGQKLSSGVRVLPLSDFLSLVLGIFWRGKLSALHRDVVDECMKRVGQLAFTPV